MEKITAIIPTGNEEHNIEAVLQSVSFADEMMVVDSYSTDRTVELAKKHTDFVIQREYENSASQKNWAIPQASHEWILLVDADERISEKLKAEIQDILKNGTDKDAFWIKRQNYFMGQKVNYSGWQGDKVIRLFKKSKCRYEDKQVHAEVLVDGETGVLKNKLDHYTYKNMEHVLAKSYRYSTWSAYDRLPKTKPVGLWHLVVKPAFGFFKNYILRLGILDGKAGLIISLENANYLFIRALKIMSLQRGEEVKKE